MLVKRIKQLLASAYFVLLIQPMIAQEPAVVEIRKAGGSRQDQELFPEANILIRSPKERVHLFHEGALIVSDISYFYSKRNFFKAEGDVVFTQGDSLRMTCNYIEYDGKTKKAMAWGNVFLKRPDMTLETDTLYLDRVEDKAFYNTRGVIVDSTSTLTSNRGIYFMGEKRYRFLSSVNIINPEYKINSEQLDYYTQLNQSYFYGPTKITGEAYEIICENGFYDTENEKGIFKKNATIFYDDKIISGDSLYFESKRDYAAATNNISIIDTLNNSVIQGHYGEVFKAKDSIIITKRALAINIVESDSLFIHADTLIAVGPEEERILKGFYDVRILKEDIRGKSDSIHLNQNTGLIKLLKKPLTKKQNQILTSAQRNLINPILWFGESQMTGDEIFLISNLETKKLDSLKIIGNAFVIEKDTISADGYNQIKGGVLNGALIDGVLDNIDVIKNTEVVYYLYSESDLELIGIDKTTCSALNIQFEENEIGDITFLVSPEGNVFPDKELPQNERKLKGFIWRKEERPETVDDLFSEADKELVFPAIRAFNGPLRKPERPVLKKQKKPLQLK